MALVALAFGVTPSWPASSAASLASAKLLSQGDRGPTAAASSRIAATTSDPTGPGCVGATLAAGFSHYLAIDAADGSVWAWGANGAGQLGNGTTVSSATPVRVLGPGGTGFLSGAVAVAGGLGFSLAAKSDGTTWGWGNGAAGQLGDGNSASSSTPVQVRGLRGAVGLAAGFAHSVAVDVLGAVWGWGDNRFGQLGNGTTTNAAAPVQVVGPGGSGFLTGVVAVAAGEFHSLALKADGTVWAWGDNPNGELGNGTTTSSSTPVQVSGLSGALAIGAGSFHSLAVRSDTTVWAWGSNAFGELGDGTTSGSLVPVHVLGPGGSGLLSGVARVAGGDGFSLAATSAGAAWGWGSNFDGELGNGTTTGSRTPVQVVGAGGKGNLSGVTLITAGSDHSGSLQSDGTVNTWGRQEVGPPNGSSLSPQPVIGLGKVAPPAPCAPPPPPPPPPGPTPQSQAGGGSPDVAVTTCNRGRPVNCATGEFWHSFVDLSIPERGLPLLFTRTYSSLSAAQDGPLGFGWTHSYNMFVTTKPSSGDVTVHEENSSAITFVRTPSGFQAPSWVRATLVENTDGTFTLTRKNQSRFIFGTTGRLLQVVDRNSEVISLVYNPSGQLATVTDPAGRNLTLSYSGNHITKVRDPIGRSVSFAYDASGNLIAATDVAGGVTRFGYDPNHLLTTVRDPRGGVLTNVYDSARRAVAQADPMNRTTRFSYGTGGTTITDPNGNLNVQQYQNNELVSLTRGFGTPLAATRRYSYDPVSLGITSVIDENGHAWKYTWDTRGNLLSATDPLGRMTRYVYDSLNDVTSVTNPAGVTSTLSYDAHGNLTAIARPLAASGPTAALSLSYSNPAHPGDVTRVTDPEGNAWALGYDAAGNRVGSSDPTGGTTTERYDAVGRLIALVSPRGNVVGANAAEFTSTIRYNAFGDPIEITDPLRVRTSSAYDPNRNPVAVTDASGHTTRYSYDADDEVIRVTRADGSSLAESYDANGNLIGDTNALGATTSFIYDALNRVIATTDVFGRTTRAGYDRAGNQTSLTDPQGRTTTVSYDAANQLTGIGYSDGTTPAVAYTYDATGRRSGMTDGTGTTRYTYDHLNRLIQSVDGSGHTVAYGYDLASNLRTLTYPDGSRVARTYDAAHRLASVRDWLDHTTTFEYDPNGNLVRQAYPNGTVATFAYDAADRLMEIKDRRSEEDAKLRGRGERDGQGETFLSFRYQRDPVGLLTTAEEAGVPKDGRTRFGYDPLDRLTRVTQGATTAYRYDAADALTQVIGPRHRTTTHTYDAAGQLTAGTVLKEDKVVQALRFSFDANGNRIAQTGDPGPTIRYGYDQANRLVSFLGPRPEPRGGSESEGEKDAAQAPSATIAASYGYNGDGFRMSKTVAGVSQIFVWDVAEGLPLLLQDGTTRYVTGPDGLPLEQVAVDGTVRFYHQDQLGSTRVLTDADGKVVATYTFDAYGNLTATEGQVRNPFRYAGQYTDGETGMLYLRARYYDPPTGQFISRDPIAWTTEPYPYSQNSPVNASDPTGTCPFCPVLIGAAAGFVIGGGVTAIDQARKGKFDLGAIAIGAGTGAVAGAFGVVAGAFALEFGATAVVAAVAGGSASGALGAGLNSAATQAYEHHGVIDPGKVIASTILGGVFGGFSGGLFAGFGRAVYGSISIGLGRAAASKFGPLLEAPLDTMLGELQSLIEEFRDGLRHQAVLCGAR